MDYSLCSRGLSWNSYYIYIGFAILTFIIEPLIYIKELKVTHHLITGL